MISTKIEAISNKNAGNIATIPQQNIAKNIMRTSKY